MADAYKLIDYDALAAYHEKNKAALEDINTKAQTLRTDLTALANKYIVVTEAEVESLWNE